MIACSKEQPLVFDNSPVLLRAPGKRPQEATPQNPRKLRLFGPPLTPPSPPPLGNSVALRRFFFPNYTFGNS